MKLLLRITWGKKLRTFKDMRLISLPLVLIGLEFASQMYGEHPRRAYRILSYDFSYDARKYSSWINQYPDGKNVGHIENAKDAVNKAIALWNEETDDFGSVYRQPYHTYHDSEQGIWLIVACVPPDTFGAIPYALIKEDGTVLAVWFE